MLHVKLNVFCQKKIDIAFLKKEFKFFFTIRNKNGGI